MSSDDHYDAILRRIAARKQAQERQSVQSVLSAALNSLNALDALAGSAIPRLKGLMCFGPSAFKGADWVGTLLWTKPATYHGYRVLTLVGIWASMRGDAIYVTFGARELAYAAPFYEAEAYHKLIGKGFDIYYKDDGRPPSEDEQRYTVKYEADKRLEIRAALEREIAKWAAEQIEEN